MTIDISDQRLLGEVLLLHGCTHSLEGKNSFFATILAEHAAKRRIKPAILNNVLAMQSFCVGEKLKPAWYERRLNEINALHAAVTIDSPLAFQHAFAPGTPNLDLIFLFACHMSNLDGI